MSIKLSPKQNLVLWQLLITGEEPAQSKVKPELTPKERKALVDQGLIELVPRGRAKHLTLTEKAWAWASEQSLESLAETKYATPLLLVLIQKLQVYVQANQVALAEFLVPPQSTTEDATATEAAKQAPDEETSTLSTIANSLTDQIQAAYHTITQGQSNVRVRLSDLRKHLVHSSKDAIDTALRQMQLSGQSVLMPMDDPQEIETEDEDASVKIGGDARHVVYLKG